MKTSANGISFIENEEGYRLTVYKDTKGNLTVGYGHKVVSGDNLKLGDTITQARANQLFTQDIVTIAENPINALSCASKLTQNQFDALASITFNGGSGVLKTSDMVTMFNYAPIFAKVYGSLTASQIDTCSRDVSNAFSYDRTLQARRNREATLFCTGEPYTHKYPVYTLE